MRAGASRIRALVRRRGVVRRAAPLAIAVLAAAGCGSSSHPAASHTSASETTSPPCLPASLSASARLAGTPIDASPAPNSGTANPHTQISFMGVPASDIRTVTVVGARSGRHSGHLRGYSQGDGARFVPDAPFQAGENVAVRAVIGASKSAAPVSFGFRVDTPYPTAAIAQFPNPPAAPADYQSFQTLPGVQAPILTVTAADRDPGAGDILTTEGPGPGRYGALIYTPQGRLVWFDQLAGGNVAENLSVQSYHGQRVLTFWQGKVLELGFGQGEDVVLNSHYQTVATVRGGNGLPADLHELQLAPHDIAYITAFNPIRCNLKPIGGPPGGAIIDTAIQAIDMKSGLVRWEWHSLDHVAATESQFQAPTSVSPWDWFHLNSIDPQPSGNLLISARNTWAEYELEGGTGKILWRLGGLKSSFTMGPGTTTAWQHDARMLPGGDLTLFDDGSDPPIESQSRAIRITLDLRHHRASLRASFTHAGAPLLGASQGNMQTLANGNTVVDYGGVPQVSEFARNGSLLFDAHLPYSMASYRGFRFAWSGAPLSPPAVAAYANNTGEETMVDASWNGATGVASWQVLAGKQPGSLAPRATIAASAFESSAILTKSYAYVAVRALDSAGHALGTSHTVAVKNYAASLPSTPRPAR